MRVALINPRWTFEGSIYFGCRDPHLPLEHGYTKALLEARGHEVLLVGAPLMDLSPDEVRAELRAFGAYSGSPQEGTGSLRGTVSAFGRST
jgi:anaerobic magnesium-protoporphyrin IX monomethyl ester cyclase